MSTRKTVSVKKIVDSLHVMLNRATDIEKPVICSMIEMMLHEANAYAGFTYPFFDFAAIETHKTIDAAIAAGLGTEYDRSYCTSRLM